MNKLKLAGDEGGKPDCVRKMFREGHAEEVASKKGTHRERNFLEPWRMDLREVRGGGR